MSENQADARLGHGKSLVVTREQLAALPEVVGTDSFKPVAHIELVVKLEEVLQARGIQIRTDNQGLRKEQFAISKDGMKLYGTMDLMKNGIEGMCASLGFRTANNKTMSLKIAAGLTVFVCDNGVFSGDILLSRKHTSGLNLMDELFRGMDQYERNYARLRDNVLRMQSFAMGNDLAKVIIHDLFVKQVMPVRLFPEVSNVYFNEFQTNPLPKFAAFSERTAWSLLNAFTEVQKEMPLRTRVKAAQLVGETFGNLVK